MTRLAHANSNEEQYLGKDFASTVGTGGVVGTKFTWPDYGKKFDTVFLNPEKNEHWKNWIALYNEKMLSKDEFWIYILTALIFPKPTPSRKTATIITRSMFLRTRVERKALLSPASGREPSNFAACQPERFTSWIT